MYRRGNKILLNKTEQRAIKRVHEETKNWPEGFKTWDYRVKRFLELTQKGKT